MVLEVIQQPFPDAHVILKLPGLRVFPSGWNPVMLCPPIEMEYVDPGITLEYMFEVHAQDNIVTEEQDFCTWVPLVQPFCLCNKKTVFREPQPHKLSVAFADFPALFLLLRSHDQIKHSLFLSVRDLMAGNWNYFG
jgi:hypothetical protein